MRKVYQFHHISIFLRLILLFLAVFIPLYILLANAYLDSAKSLKEEIQKSLLYKIDFYIDNFEQTISHIFQLQGSYTSDRDFRMYAFLTGSMNGYEKKTHLKALLVN